MRAFPSVSQIRQTFSSLREEVDLQIREEVLREMREGTAPATSLDQEIREDVLQDMREGKRRGECSCI